MKIRSLFPSYWLISVSCCRLIKSEHSSTIHKLTAWLKHSNTKENAKEGCREGKEKLHLSYILFVIHKTPQASTGFTFFGLFFGRRFWGLDLIQEAWEKQPLPFHFVMEFIPYGVASILKQHTERAQAEQKKIYNQPAKHCKFQLGDRVLILLPSANCKFMLCYQSLYRWVQWTTDCE